MVMIFHDITNVINTLANWNIHQAIESQRKIRPASEARQLLKMAEDSVVALSHHANHASMHGHCKRICYAALKTGSPLAHVTRKYVAAQVRNGQARQEDTKTNSSSGSPKNQVHPRCAPRDSRPKRT